MSKENKEGFEKIEAALSDVSIIQDELKEIKNDVDIINSYQYSGFIRILLTGSKVTEKDDTVIISRERIPYKLSVNFGSMYTFCCSGRNDRLLDLFGRKNFFLDCFK